MEPFIQAGTMPYLCPEKLSGLPYDPYKADAYAFGVMLVHALFQFNYLGDDNADYYNTFVIKHVFDKELKKAVRDESERRRPEYRAIRRLIGPEHSRCNIRDVLKDFVDPPGERKN